MAGPRYTQPCPITREGEWGKMSLKEDLRDLLARGRLEEIAELAVRRRRSLGSLVSLTFDRDPLVSWRAIEAMGLACDRIAEEDPECVRQHVRRLYWLITEESGGICWRAPEAMAEVVHRQSKLLANIHLCHHSLLLHHRHILLLD